MLASASFFFFKFQFLLIRTGIFQLLVPWMFSLHLIQCSPYPSVGNNLINGLRLCQIKQIFSLKKKKKGEGGTQETNSFLRVLSPLSIYFQIVVPKEKFKTKLA